MNISSVPAGNQTLSVQAVSIADSNATETAILTLVPAPVVSIQIAPGVVELAPGESTQFSASGSDGSSPAVNWSLTPPIGTISATGLYTAPSIVDTRTNVSIKATSSADSQIAAAATVNLLPSPQITLQLTPASAELTSAKSQKFDVQAAGGDPGALQWSIQPQTGSLSVAGKTAVYVAPTAISAPETVTINLMSAMNPSKIFAKAVVTLLPLVSVAISPQSASLMAGEQAQFSASVSGTSNQAVRWTLEPPVGSISNSGLYQAPEDLAAPESIQVIAQSLADPTKSAQAAVAVQPPLPGVEFEFSDKQLIELKYQGVSFYAPHNNLMRGATFRSPDGTEATVGWINPSSTSKGDGWFQHVYNQGDRHEFAVRVTWSLMDRNTLRATATVTNRDEYDALARLQLLFLPFQLPSPAQEWNQNIPVTVGIGGLPAAALSGKWGSLAYWQDGYPTASKLFHFYGSEDQKEFDIAWMNYTRIGPDYTEEETIGPQSSQAFNYYLRFSDQKKTALELAPEAYAQFREAYPFLLDWPDRRPIATWFIAEGAKRSAVNPRGYLWDPDLSVRDFTTFQSRVLVKTNEIIDRMNAMSTRPQGIIIWDLEGQEFNHAFTYVGSPEKLPDLAPEMDLVVDEVFRRFTAAGYLTGLTIRPQDFGIGPELPETCSAEGYPWSNDKFVLTTAQYPFRSYRCIEPGEWQVTSLGPGAQKGYRSRAAVFSVLQRKIAYAIKRWGTRIFYVDSSVYDGGGPFDFLLWRDLSERFPDVLFMPEIEQPLNYGSTAPYNEARQNVFFSNSKAVAVYPDAFSVLAIADIDYQKWWDVLVKSRRAGNIFLLRAWFNSGEIPQIEQLYLDAAR